VVRDKTSMPGQDGLGLHEEDRPAITVEYASQRGEDRSVGWFEAGPWHLTVQDRELMAQDEDLGIFGTICAAAQHQQADREADKTVEVGHPPILAGLSSRRPVEREAPGQGIRMSFRHPHPRRTGTTTGATVIWSSGTTSPSNMPDPTCSATGRRGHCARSRVRFRS
jgi:hypothetical protein